MPQVLQVHADCIGHLRSGLLGSHQLLGDLGWHRSDVHAHVGARRHPICRLSSAHCLCRRNRPACTTAYNPSLPSFALDVTGDKQEVCTRNHVEADGGQLSIRLSAMHLRVSRVLR